MTEPELTFTGLFFLWRKPGLSHDEFVQHYETTHMEVVGKDLLPPREHERNYTLWDHPLTSSDRPNGDFGIFDSMTKFAFKDYDERERQREAYADPRIRDPIDADEATFVDLSRRILFIVEEKGRASSRPDIDGGVRLLRLVKRLSTADSRDAFESAYEASVAEAFSSSTPGPYRYRRNYLRPEHHRSYLGHPLGGGVPAQDWSDFHLVEELQFEDGETAQERLSSLKSLAHENLAEPVDAWAVVVEQSSVLPEEWLRKLGRGTAAA